MSAKRTSGKHGVQEEGAGEGSVEADRLVLSDDEDAHASGRRTADQVIQMLFGESEESEGRREEESMDVRKIIYCSRTHSQLSQFMREVKRTAWGCDLKAVALASRKSMCINEKVTKLKSAVRINAACLDLCKNGGKDGGTDDAAQGASDAASARKMRQAGSKKCAGGCQYRSEDACLDLRDAVLSKVQDIEDVVQLGKQTNTCPYYGSRAALQAAELVTIPYNSLVHKGTREALGLSLAGNVVIIDEAHNLIDSINGVHSALLSQATTNLLLALFSDYLERFVTRLSAKNAGHVRQSIQVLKALASFFSSNLPSLPPAYAARRGEGSAAGTAAVAKTGSGFRVQGLGFRRRQDQCARPSVPCDHSSVVGLVGSDTHMPALAHRVSRPRGTGSVGAGHRVNRR